jgi:Type II secretion system (T2SS), protein N
LKRGPLILTIVAGVLVFLGVLVLYLPASWFASMMPPQVRCTELGGSIWQGECLGLSYQNAALGDATWNLSALAAATGRLKGDVDLRGTLINGRADLDVSFAGAGELRNVSARFPLDPALSPQFSRDQRGNVIVELERLQIAAGGVPQLIEGKLELHDFRMLSPQPMVLGSYAMTFDGVARPDGTTVGTVKDLGGPFKVDGTFTLTPPNAYSVVGFITGRSADAERIVRQITFGVPPDASGRSEFRFEGTL